MSPAKIVRLIFAPIACVALGVITTNVEDASAKFGLNGFLANQLQKHAGRPC